MRWPWTRSEPHRRALIDLDALDLTSVDVLDGDVSARPAYRPSWPEAPYAIDRDDPGGLADLWEAIGDD